MRSKPTLFLDPLIPPFVTLNVILAILVAFLLVRMQTIERNQREILSQIHQVTPTFPQPQN